jgi:hypothetical protein
MTKLNQILFFFFVVTFLTFHSERGETASAQNCPASLGYIYNANSNVCDIGKNADAIKLAPNGFAVVEIYGKTPGSWICYRINNTGPDTFFIPGGGSNDGTNTRKDFLQYCGLDATNSSLDKKYSLNCTKSSTCDLCAQDINGNDLLSSASISQSTMNSYTKISDLCVTGATNFSIPQLVSGTWNWTCGAGSGLSTTCTAKLALTGPPPVDGQCGNNVPGFDVRYPLANNILCQQGSVQNLSKAGAMNIWDCSGTNGGNPANGCSTVAAPPCSASQLTMTGRNASSGHTLTVPISSFDTTINWGLYSGAPAVSGTITCGPTTTNISFSIMGPTVHTFNVGGIPVEIDSNYNSGGNQNIWRGAIIIKQP